MIKVQNFNMNKVHNDEEHEPIIFLEIVKYCFMEHQEYSKSFITKNDEVNTKKYYFGFQRKNHPLCKNK